MHHFFQDLDIYVVGLGEAAVEERCILLSLSRSVTLLVEKINYQWLNQ